MYEQREKDIQELCKQILEMPSEFWDNPNGTYEFSCPFCSAIEYMVGFNMDISKLKHDNNCAYLIAKDLSTNGGKLLK